ncbi:MAG: class I SAM-dependent methyltransferase [Pontixanthobacter sp.]
MIRKWYDNAVLPRILGCACGNAAIRELRAQIVPLAKGNVFELGIGGGLNQPFYDRSRVTGLAGVDPAAAMLDRADAAIRDRGWHVDLRQGVGEDIPFASAGFDTVVCTYTLCSVDAPATVLSELRRVLKPGGCLLYLEHGRAPDNAAARWQRRIEPVWKRAMGGCHLTRPVAETIRGAGFTTDPIGARYIPRVPRWVGWMEWGVAVK